MTYDSGQHVYVTQYCGATLIQSNSVFKITTDDCIEKEDFILNKHMSGNIVTK